MRAVYAECMNGIYTKEVTCRKGLKVPFAVMGHIIIMCRSPTYEQLKTCVCIERTQLIVRTIWRA